MRALELEDEIHDYPDILQSMGSPTIWINLTTTSLSGRLMGFFNSCFSSFEVATQEPAEVAAQIGHTNACDVSVADSDCGRLLRTYQGGPELENLQETSILAAKNHGKTCRFDGTKCVEYEATCNCFPCQIKIFP